jgi:two-component sensor histidine kinase
LSRNVFRTYTPTGVALDIDLKGVLFGVDKAIPCGLIVNELVSNSLKYAFPDNRRGRVFVHTSVTKEGDIVLSVGDDGIGLSPDYDFANSSTLGLQLVSMLVKQLGGTMKLVCERGTMFKIAFPSPVNSAVGTKIVAPST